MKVSIIGLPGSGKTTLAARISHKLDIPHIHIDRYWFEAGGSQGSKTTPPDEMERIRTYISQQVFPIIATDAWVSDGFYPRIQEEIAKQADIVIYLDIPLQERLLNHAERILKPSTRHKELTLWNELTFFYEIIRRTYTTRTKYKPFLREFQKKIETLRSRAEIEAFLKQF